MQARQWNRLEGFLACNDAKYSEETGEEIGDPTETAFIKYAKDKKLGYYDIMRDITRFDEIPFDSDRKMMTTLDRVKRDGEIKNISYTKGAIDSVIVRCDRILDEDGIREITNEDVVRATQSADIMSSDALRVLALAYREGDTVPQEKDMIGSPGKGYDLRGAGRHDRPAQGRREGNCGRMSSRGHRRGHDHGRP